MIDLAIRSEVNQMYNRDTLSKSYDYIVVGSGSAGSVLARRLAEDQTTRVLVLEAGGTDQEPNVIDPSRWYLNPGSALDWGYTAMPQAFVNGRALSLTMGKVIGGGSSVNALAWVRGHKSDFDAWADAAQDPSWGYEHVLSIYRRIENWAGRSDPKYRGEGGPVHVEPSSNPNPLSYAMVKGCASIGIPEFDGHNGTFNESDGGASIEDMIIRKGRRASIFEAYVTPVLAQSNITILTGAEVSHVTMEGTDATGVAFLWRGRIHIVRANRETILCAGAMNTPKILMLSGIGPEKKLKAHGIRVELDLPGVGENFQDHPIVASCMWEYKEGSYAPPHNNGGEAIFMCKSDSSLPRPDLQPSLVHIPYTSEITAKRFRVPPASWSIAPGLMRPKSIGSIRLASNDFRDDVVTESNFLKHPDDMRALVRGVEICREVGNSQPMRSFAGREIMPGNLKGADLEDFIRDAVITYRHQSCTCKMGHDEMAVVDNNLKVRGIANLRIADASIMPEVTTSNTMAPTVVIGERLAEILKS